MTEFRMAQKLPALTAACAGLLLTLGACGGSDSTAPAPSVDSNAALQSLALGLGSLTVASPTGPLGDASFGGIAPLLDQINVTIDGTSQSMFALGLRESYPPGTCEESINASIPPIPGVCTLPEPQIVFILWQSRAANVPPDKMILILSDVGTTNFSPVSSQSGDIPMAVAIYVEGSSLWISDSGSLSSAVASTGQTCSLPLPLYATGGTCSVATFDEQGAISFEPTSDVSGNAPVNLIIPRETVHGLWQALTGIQPVASIQQTIRLQKLFTPR